jgi:hypothetical protein
MDDAPETLHATTEQYLRSAPDLKYPAALVSKFPRIANEIVRLKDDPAGLDAYFKSMLTDERGTRKGFAFEVLMDIEDIREIMCNDRGGISASDNRNWV